MLTECLWVLRRRTAVPVVKQLSTDIAQFFAGHCPVSGANIQAWYRDGRYDSKTNTIVILASIKLISCSKHFDEQLMSFKIKNV